LRLTPTLIAGVIHLTAEQRAIVGDDRAARFQAFVQPGMSLGEIIFLLIVVASHRSLSNRSLLFRPAFNPVYRA